MEDEGDKDGREDDEGELEEEGSEGVRELEMEGESTLSEPELCRQWRDSCWVVGEVWLGSGW